jgi:membrane associated rhomboid family serine protease
MYNIIVKMPPRINLPPLTRALLLTLLSLSLLNAFLRFRSWSASTPTNEQSATAPSIYLTSPLWAISYLVLIPTQSIKFPWTFLTSALIENNIVSLAISSAVVWFGGKYLERAWGGQEFAKFVLFVTMIPNILTFFMYAVWHGLASNAPEQ